MFEYNETRKEEKEKSKSAKKKVLAFSFQICTRTTWNLFGTDFL